MRKSLRFAVLLATWFAAFLAIALILAPPNHFYPGIGVSMTALPPGHLAVNGRNGRRRRNLGVNRD